MQCMSVCQSPSCQAPSDGLVVGFICSLAGTPCEVLTLNAQQLLTRM